MDPREKIENRMRRSKQDSMMGSSFGTPMNNTALVCSEDKKEEEDEETASQLLEKDDDMVEAQIGPELN